MYARIAFAGVGSLQCSPRPYCTKFVKLILRKMIKIVATICHILKLKCTKFDFGWGSTPDPAGGGELTVLPQIH